MLKDTPRAGYENDQGSETASVAGSVERLNNAWLDISADGYARLGHQTRADATFFRPGFDPSGLQSAYLGSAWLLAPTTFPDTAGFPILAVSARTTRAMVLATSKLPGVLRRSVTSPAGVRKQLPALPTTGMPEVGFPCVPQTNGYVRHAFPRGQTMDR